MFRLMLSLLIVFIVAGCKSRPLGPYTSPRVRGQVLAADTERPLAGVSVTRGSGEPQSMSPPTGGELLMRKVPVKTDANGVFELPDEHVLSVVRGTGWDRVLLSFDRSGYQPFQTNCPASTVTNAMSGDEVLDVGRIFLQPVARSSVPAE